jgi:hypothetical protein
MITLCPNPGCRRELPATAPRCTACGAVIVRRSAGRAPAAPRPESHGSTSAVVGRALRLALLFLIVLMVAVGLAGTMRGKWEVREVAGLHMETPSKFRPGRAAKEFPPGTALRANQRAPMGGSEVEVLQIAYDPRRISFNLEKAGRGVATLLSKNPRITSIRSNAWPVRVPDATEARRITLTYKLGSRPARNEVLLLRQGRQFWLVEVSGRDTPENQLRASRILDSVKAPRLF